MILVLIGSTTSIANHQLLISSICISLFIPQWFSIRGRFQVFNLANSTIHTNVVGLCWIVQRVPAFRIKELCRELGKAHPVQCIYQLTGLLSITGKLGHIFSPSSIFIKASGSCFQRYKLHDANAQKSLLILNRDMLKPGSEKEGERISIIRVNVQAFIPCK